MAAQVVLLKQPLICVPHACTRHFVVGSQSTAQVVAVSVDTMVSSELTLYQAALATSGQPILAQCGLTDGAVIVVYVPIVQFDVPDTPDNEETNVWNFKGTALGVNGNDVIAIGLF